MDKEASQIIVNKYRLLGLVKGSELLLPFDVAEQFLSDVEAQQGLILGGVAWDYVNRDENWIREAIETDFSTPDEILLADNRIAMSVEIARKNLETIRRGPYDFVSFDIDIPPEWWRETLGL
jgi:hypothetical protein